MNLRKKEFMVDTNVAIVANGNQTPQASLQCILSCAENIEKIQNEGILLLDDKYLTYQEYENYLSYLGEPGAGDRFFFWILMNQGNPQSCRIIPVKPDPQREFEEFPADPALTAFDRDDRKFVAVALASGTQPEVLNATDTDWWHHRQALRYHGVNVTFLCPELMR